MKLFLIQALTWLAEQTDNEVDDLLKPSGMIDNKSDYAYIFEPHDYYTQAAIYKILDQI